MGFLAFIGFVILVIGVVGLARGRIQWARISNRRTAGLVTAAGLVLFVLFAALSAPADDNGAKKDSEAPQASRLSAPTMSPTATSTSTTSPTPAPVATTATASPATPPPVTNAPPSTRPPATANPAPATTRPAAPAPATTHAAPPATQAPPPPAPATTAPAPAGFVHPGSYCSPEGATGVTENGTPMICGTTPNSPTRARWHSR